MRAAADATGPDGEEERGAANTLRKFWTDEEDAILRSYAAMASVGSAGICLTHALRNALVKLPKRSFNAAKNRWCVSAIAPSHNAIRRRNCALLRTARLDIDDLNRAAGIIHRRTFLQKAANVPGGRGGGGKCGDAAAGRAERYAARAAVAPADAAGAAADGAGPSRLRGAAVTPEPSEDDSSDDGSGEEGDEGKEEDGAWRGAHLVVCARGSAAWPCAALSRFADFAHG